ncbi:MAG: cysteine synthase A [Deltaproteobacteria bacterium]|nr:cysteine synthase A [Deltaproteobacteria bacterium]
MIHDSILTLVGRTPMVRLRKLGGPKLGEVIAKLESFNPAGSVKDRASLAMIEAAEREGRLEPGDVLVEPTSGNTGIGLALVAAVKGYRLVVVMPDDTPRERQSVLRNYGAQVVLTPAGELMQGAIARAKKIVEDNPRCRLLQQFENQANPDVHRRTTAREILEDCGGKIDAFVCGVGTGGTITGVGEVLKHASGATRIIGVEPEGSAVLSGKPAGQHTVWGIGAGFVPPILNRSVIDEVMTCRDSVAYEVAYRLAREEGISAGVSAGAATWCALRVAHRLGPGTRTVVLLADAWDRYTSADLSNVAAAPVSLI